MDKKTKLGSIAESRVLTELLKCEFSVFVQFSGKEPFDLAAYRDGIFVRIQVKSTTVRSLKGDSFIVQLKSVRHNRTKNTIKRFDSSLCDVLAVYVDELDRVCFIRASDLEGQCCFQIADAGKSSNKRLRFGVDDESVLETWRGG